MYIVFIYLIKPFTHVPRAMMFCKLCVCNYVCGVLGIVPIFPE